MIDFECIYRKSVACSEGRLSPEAYVAALDRFATRISLEELRMITLKSSPTPSRGTPNPTDVPGGGSDHPPAAPTTPQPGKRAAA